MFLASYLDGAKTDGLLVFHFEFSLFKDKILFLHFVVSI